MKFKTFASLPCRLIGVITLTSAAMLNAQDKAPAAPAKEAPAKEAPAAPAKEAPAEEKAAPKQSPKEVKTNASFALGLRAGSDFSQEFGRFGLGMDDLEMKSFLKGFETAYTESELEIDEDVLKAAMEAFGNMIQERETKLAETNKVASEEFIKENGKRKGVVTTESGLQYEVIKKGGKEKFEAPADPAAGMNKIFKVHYKGTLADGTEFDASPEGEAVPMTLQVVPGFREALMTMPVGAKWKLFLSPDLAYGERRAGLKIGPNCALIFELELVAIEDAPKPQGLPFQIPGQ